MQSLAYLAIALNALFILWIGFNAMDEWGQPIGSVQIAALTGLVLLLVLNIILLSKQK